MDDQNSEDDQGHRIAIHMLFYCTNLNIGVSIKKGKGLNKISNISPIIFLAICVITLHIRASTTKTMATKL